MPSFTTGDGLRLAYDVTDFTDPWRRPETLVLLHAAMGAMTRWYAMVPLLSRQFRVVRMDLRGHGASEVPPEDPPLTMERLVADLAGLMDHLGLGAAHLVGNSAGGYIAQRFAIAAPARTRSLVLFGATPGLRESQARSWLPRVAAEGLRGFLAATIADRFPPGHDPAHVAWFLDDAGSRDAAFIGRFIGLMAGLWWMEDLGRIACPTLLVAPGAETVGSGVAYAEMARRIPDCELVSYAGLPHNICDIVPERCAAEVLGFLGRRFVDR